jgi:hypothetical protein
VCVWGSGLLGQQGDVDILVRMSFYPVTGTQSVPPPRPNALTHALHSLTHIVEAALPAVGYAAREHTLRRVLDAREPLMDDRLYIYM